MLRISWSNKRFSTTRGKSTKYETLFFIDSEKAPENGKVASFRNVKLI